MSADRVAALAEVLESEIRIPGPMRLRKSEAIVLTIAESRAAVRVLLESPAMRDLLAEERARALREAARDLPVWEAGNEVIAYNWLRKRAEREQP